MLNSDIIHFIRIVGKSKKIKRAGWVREGVHSPESIAEHSFRLIVLAMVFAPILHVNQDKLIKMAIIHDLGETATGDLVSERGKRINHKLRAKKEQVEKLVVSELLGKFNKEYHSIFKEMIERKTPEAEIFWQLDKLEMAFQAKEYELEQNMPLTEFFENAKLHIKNPYLRNLLFELIKRDKN